MLVQRLERAARGELAARVRRDLAKQTSDEIRRTFAERRAPDGRAWKPVMDGGTPLVDSGALRDGFDVRATDAGVTVRSRVAYATVHQRGGRIRRRRRRKAKARTRVRAHGGVIPARPMVPTSRWGPAPERRLRAVSSRAVRAFFVKQ